MKQSWENKEKRKKVKLDTDSSLQSHIDIHAAFSICYQMPKQIYYHNNSLLSTLLLLCLLSYKKDIITTTLFLVLYCRCVHFYFFNSFSLYRCWFT